VSDIDTSDLGYSDMTDMRFADGVGPKQTTTVNMAFSTTEEEVMNGGWTRDTMPTGAHKPPRAFVVGSRGESGMDSDVHPEEFDKSTYTER